MSARDHSRESRNNYKRLQRHKKRYMELREELQLAGEIPTEPVGAIRDERVAPESQGGNPALAGLVVQAIRQGWKTKEEVKPELVDEMVGIVQDPDETSKNKIAAFNALRTADKDQYERDYPEEAAKARGGGNKVAVVNNNTVNVVDKDERERRVLEALALMDTGARKVIRGDGRQQSMDEAQASNGREGEHPTG